MIHSNKNKQLGRKRNQRNALVKTLAVSLVRDGKITTTTTKAKVLRTFIEKLVTKARPGTLAAMRLVASRIGVSSAKKMIKEIAPKYKERTGGYTRVTKLERRLADGAEMAVIEFI
ncbi:MAG: 50S ribosomal protein L17 [Candidatus Paceibacterota bacterium]|jgi:large subunit ribosomal protein L17